MVCWLFCMPPFLFLFTISRLQRESAAYWIMDYNIYDKDMFNSFLLAFKMECTWLECTWLYCNHRAWVVHVGLFVSVILWEEVSANRKRFLGNVQILVVLDLLWIPLKGYSLCFFFIYHFQRKILFLFIYYFKILM